ncbi:hypothetical protein V8E55_002618 [Tylopilus felleus]
MSSDLQSAVELIWMNNYTSVVIVTAVVYDYFLTFTREVDYVWGRSWTWVSTMFVLVRYIGLGWAILGGLVGSTFIPGPLNVSTAIFLTTFWAFPIFLAIVDCKLPCLIILFTPTVLSIAVVMIFRVYAMWNQSTGILYVLLFIYAAQVISSFIITGLYYNPNTNLTVTIVQVVNFSFCNSAPDVPNPSLLLFGHSFPRFALSAILLVLAVIPTLKQAFGMYKTTKQWQPNLYMHQLVRDGILYFLV